MANSLPGVGSLFGEAWSLYKQRFVTFFAVMLPPALFGFLYVLLVQRAVPELAAGREASKTMLFGAVGFFFALILVFVQTWGQMALLYAIKESPEGIGVKESYRKGLGKVLPYFWLAFLSGLIIFGGFALFVIPGIILSVSLLFAFIILVAEDQKGLNALLRSSAYVKGRWGAVFFRMLAIVLFALAVYAILVFVVRLFPVIIDLAPNLILSLFLIPIATIYWFTIYRHLKTSRGEVPASTGGKKAGFIFLAILGLVAFLSIPFWIRFLPIPGGKGLLRTQAAIASRNTIVQTVSSGIALKKAQNLIDGRTEAVVLDYEPSGPCQNCFSEVLVGGPLSDLGRYWSKISDRQYVWHDSQSGDQACYEFTGERLAETACP